MSASDFANALPLLGGLGGVEVALAVLLSLLAGVDIQVAAALAFLFRLWGYWFVLLLGGASTAYLALD